ncbi:hypothetical protein FPANT_9960 [Fusarium pseudoanthophilum]|uniref:Cerato-platanin n=1 Tax=Fusarium pseudoanthophilum TaxID=48495 RepID=A0A8H5NTE2_9HYPO|nr:hypothetical protein FPANT_9960 [Fusarium pseudoanthophilum]
MLRLSLLVHSLLISLTSARKSDGGTVWATPHDSYSSSIGVLGCKVNTNRIAYWPYSVDCNNICIALTYQDRTVHLLRVDQSQGAYDVSYDAWNYLYTGYSATDKPTAGGPVEMTYSNVDASKCSDLIHTKKSRLPLSAANSMNFLTSCLDRNESTWVGDNYVLYNILDSICTLGHDETCELDYPAENQAKCPHTMGVPDELKGEAVVNIRYPSGEKVSAADGKPVDEDVAMGLKSPALAIVVLLAACLVLGM